MLDSPRLVVTGHDSDGKSVVISDQAIPVTSVFGTAEVHQLWATKEGNGTGSQTDLSVVDFSPGSPGPETYEAVHYGIILEGELHMMVDETDTVLRPGDILVQLGTTHQWENRSEKNVRTVFVGVTGQVAR